MSAAIEVDGLTIRFPSHYGDVDVVQDVSLRLERGTTLGLVGESGSGKSLIGRAILGLLPPGATVSGRVRVEGVDMLGADAETLRQARGAVVATVFQDALAALNPSRTIGGHIEDVWRSAGGARDALPAAAHEALELAALAAPERVLASYPHELSGGMRQRALIAIALLRRPSVLIADEPTTALDRVVEAEVLGTLERLQQELGLSILLVSHDFAVIRRLASRVVVLYAGQVCEVGASARIMAGSRHPYSRGLTAAVESLAARARPLATVPGTVPAPTAFAPGCRFVDRCPEAFAACNLPRPMAGDGEDRAWCHRVAADEHQTAVRQEGAADV